MKIVVLGYMACGKSTLGKVLASEKNINFIDLDRYIEEKEALSIAEIFKKRGEIYFRKLEIVSLEEILTTKSNFVLSLGGGTPCYGTNMELIKKMATATIYLKASIATLKERLLLEKEERPLVASLSKENLQEYIGKHLFERAPFYEQAKIVISINGKTIDQILQEVKGVLN